MRSLLEEWGLGMQLRLKTDSSVANSLSQRLGVGKMKHMQTRFLWLQQAVQWGQLVIVSVPTKLNYADIYTKAVPAKQMEAFLKSMGCLL